MKRNLSL